jgi:hypothetical protein
VIESGSDKNQKRAWPPWIENDEMRTRFVDVIVRTGSVSKAADAIKITRGRVANTMSSAGGKAKFLQKLGIGEPVVEDPEQKARARSAALQEIAHSIQQNSQPKVPGVFMSRGTGLVRRGKKDSGVLVPLVQLVFSKPGSHYDPIEFDKKLVERVTQDLSDKRSALHKAARAAGIGRVDVVTHPASVKGISKPTAKSVLIKVRT